MEPSIEDRLRQAQPQRYAVLNHERLQRRGRARRRRVRASTGVVAAAALAVMVAVATGLPPSPSVPQVADQPPGDAPPEPVDAIGGSDGDAWYRLRSIEAAPANIRDSISEERDCRLWIEVGYEPGRVALTAPVCGSPTDGSMTLEGPAIGPADETTGQVYLRYGLVGGQSVSAVEVRTESGELRTVETVDVRGLRGAPNARLVWVASDEPIDSVRPITR